MGEKGNSLELRYKLAQNAIQWAHSGLTHFCDTLGASGNSVQLRPEFAHYAQSLVHSESIYYGGGCVGEGEASIPWDVAPRFPTKLHNGPIVVRTAIEILREEVVIPLGSAPDSPTTLNTRSVVGRPTI